jgi:hypothetical protein
VKSRLPSAPYCNSTILGDAGVFCGCLFAIAPAGVKRNKIYLGLPDKEAEKDGDLCLVDEGGEDDLLSAERLVAIDMLPAVKGSLVKAS